MRVGVSGGQRDGGLISANGVWQASGFVEHVAEIEISQRVTRIDFYRLAVEAFSLHVIMAVIKERAQVDIGRGMRGIKVNALLVTVNGFSLRAGIFFQGDAAGKKFTGGFRGAHSVDLV